MIGVGILIIFIALVLVAAVAATVMIFTAGNLQNRGLGTGKDAEKGVTSSIEVVSLMGSNGAIGKDLEHFEIFVRLAPGSDPIKLNTTLIIIDTEAVTQVIDFNATSNQFPTGTTTYNIEYLKRGPDWLGGFLHRGDTAKIRFNYYEIADPTATTGGVSENKQMRIKIIPIRGTAALVEFKTPDRIVVERFTLWP